MTPQDLDRLDELAAKATPGPWEALELSMPGEALLRMGAEQSFSTRQVQVRDADAAFIAAARTAIPALVAEVRRLRDECGFNSDSLEAATKNGRIVLERAMKAEAEVRRLRRRDAMLSESLWQAWKALHEHDTPEEAMKDAESFLRSVCIDEGIMGEDGGRLAGREWSDNGTTAAMPRKGNEDGV